MTVDQSQLTHYLIQENNLSLDNRFTITDDSGTVHYKVNSSFFTMGDKLCLLDANGNELMRIRQENLHLRLTYKVFSTHSAATARQIATIKRTGPFWQHKLEISSDNGEYIMQKKGGIASNEFTLTKNDEIVATVTKDASLIKNLYWVNIVDSKERDHALILTMVIVLSCAQRLPVDPMIKSAGNGTKNH